MRKQKCYVIEEYRSASERWVQIGSEMYGRDEKGEFSVRGECYRDSGIHGTYDKEYALHVCGRLNGALDYNTLSNYFYDFPDSEERIKEFDNRQITKFRVVKYKIKIEKKVMTE